MEILLGFICLWPLFGTVAAMIGAKKGEGCLMFFLGFLLGPFGILIALFSSGNRKVCPHCRELIDQDATVCSHCHRDQPRPPKQTSPAPAHVATAPISPTPSPPKPAANPSIPCPLCGKPLRVSTLKQGENWCIHCFEKFIAE
jgi:ribosomal protein L40E